MIKKIYLYKKIIQKLYIYDDNKFLRLNEISLKMGEYKTNEM